MNSQRNMLPAVRYTGPATMPSLLASAAVDISSSTETLGSFVSDGGVLGQDFTAFIVAPPSSNIYSVRFNSSLGSNISWSYPVSYSYYTAAVMGPRAVYVTSGLANEGYTALNKSTGEVFWSANFTFLDTRLVGTRLLGYVPAARLGHGPTPSVGADKQRRVQSTQTTTNTRTSAATQTVTASFNAVVNNVYCGKETLLFQPLITSAGLIIQCTLRCILGINSTNGRLVWYRIIGNGPNFSINVGNFGSVSFTSSLVLSKNESIFCGGTSTGSAFCSWTADGSLIWTTKISTDAGGLTTMPLIHNDTLFVRFKTCMSGLANNYGHCVSAFTLSGIQLWNTSLLSKSPAFYMTNNPISVLPSFISPTVDALVMTARLSTKLSVLVFNPVNASLLRTISLPCAGGSSSASSVIAVDASNALFIMCVDGSSFLQTLYRINATTGTITYSLPLDDASYVSSPNYLSLVVGSCALLISDQSGRLFVYR